MTLLYNHTSPESAHLVESYPYGFSLRCKIRYWLEFSKNKGVRLVSQTTNPKKGDVWNKPKYSTYCVFGGAMFLDENSHVQWSGLHEYMDLKESLAWMEKFSSAIHPDCKEKAGKWMRAKLLHDKEKSQGKYRFLVNGMEQEPLKSELNWDDEEVQAKMKLFPIQ
jgi:hypothetical protein